MVLELYFHKRHGELQAKHANGSVFDCTDEHKALFRVPASEETKELWIYIYIYIFTVYYSDAIQI